MEGGPKLDELVVSHVLGGGAGLRPYSTDLNAAWELAEKVCDLGYRLQLDGSRLWLARFYKSAAHTLETQAFSATSGSPAAAICLAALTMKGIKPA